MTGSQRRREGTDGPEAPFLWGVSTSSYQHEGGYNGEGQPQNNWGDWERSGRVEKTGRAVDFWNRYPEDFSLASKLGLNAFRLGVDWSRIQPGSEPGKVPAYSPEALGHYAKILGSARRAGLEPLVTLFHFAHPVWLGLDPWLEEKTIGCFVDFACHTVEFLNRALAGMGLEPLRWLITINEPNMLAINSYMTRFFPSGPRHGYGQALAAYQNMVRAHVLVFRALHELYARHPEWGKARISFNNYASDLYWLDKLFVDIVAAPRRGVPREKVASWLEEKAEEFEGRLREARLPLRKTLPYWAGTVLKWWLFRKGRKILQKHRLDLLLDLIYERPGELPLDYVAVDYYDPFVGNIFRFPRFEEFGIANSSLRGWMINSITSKQWDWPALPQGLGFFVRIYESEFPGLPVVIAENGMARLRLAAWKESWRKDRMKRAEYLERHLNEVMQLRREGSRLAGYFHWSLTDNYEWGTYAPRFGLYHIDLGSEQLAREPGVAVGIYERFVRRDKMEIRPQDLEGRRESNG